jgi:iron complex outermembrane receptor protein
VSAGLAWRRKLYDLSEGDAAGWSNGPLFCDDPCHRRRIPGYYSGITQVV